MIHLVVLRGNPPAMLTAVAAAKELANGWAMLAEGPSTDGKTAAMLVNAPQSSEVLRNFLGKTTGLQILVVPLKPAWAAKGLPEIVETLLSMG